MQAADLYETDFVKWTERNASLLRSRQIDAADLDHIAEEIEDMGKERRDALKSQLRRLIAHLLKHEYQPAKRSTGWLRTILNSRVRIADLLEENPSLKAGFDEFMINSYPRAVKLAAIETKLQPSRFPARCPYTKAQILDDDFLP